MSEEAFEAIPAEVEQVGRRVIGCAIKVHQSLGPGFKESIYVEAMCIEMHARALKFEREKPLTVVYSGREIPGQRLDLIVERVVIVECKAVDAIMPIHTRQISSYLRTTGVRLGYIFNFNVGALMPRGFKRVVV